MFCTWVLFLSLGGTLGRDVRSNVMFWFLGEDGIGGSGPRNKTGSTHPNSNTVPTSSAQPISPAIDSL